MEDNKFGEFSSYWWCYSGRFYKFSILFHFWHLISKLMKYFVNVVYNVLHLLQYSCLKLIFHVLVLFLLFLVNKLEKATESFSLNLHVRNSVSCLTGKSIQKAIKHLMATMLKLTNETHGVKNNKGLKSKT